LYQNFDPSDFGYENTRNLLQRLELDADLERGEALMRNAGCADVMVALGGLNRVAASNGTSGGGDSNGIREPPTPGTVEDYCDTINRRLRQFHDSLAAAATTEGVGVDVSGSCEEEAPPALPPRGFRAKSTEDITADFSASPASFAMRRSVSVPGREAAGGGGGPGHRGSTSSSDSGFSAASTTPAGGVVNASASAAEAVAAAGGSGGNDPTFPDVVSQCGQQWNGVVVDGCAVLDKETRI